MQQHRRPAVATRLQAAPSEDRLFGPNPAVALNTTYYEGQRSVYGRHTNSTWEAFEAVVGELEGGQALAFASGMAAMLAVLLSVGARAFVVADAYMGTRQLVSWLRERTPQLYVAESSQLEVLVESCEPGDLVVLETPSNPLLATYPIAELAAALHRRGALLAVDSTLATPVLQQPLALGADVVIHSASKFLSGHADVLGGVVVAGDDVLASRLAEARELTGGVIGPVEAYLCFRGMRTLAVRVERASATATELAERLRARVGTWVRYPGFNEALVGRGRQQAAGGAVIALVFPTSAVADAFVDALELFHHATSLGGVESLAERRSRYPAEDRVPEGLVRLSIGLEDPEDLWEDLDRALTVALS